MGCFFNILQPCVELSLSSVFTMISISMGSIDTKPMVSPAAKAAPTTQISAIRHALPGLHADMPRCHNIQHIPEISRDHSQHEAHLVETIAADRQQATSKFNGKQLQFSLATWFSTPFDQFQCDSNLLRCSLGRPNGGIPEEAHKRRFLSNANTCVHWQPQACRLPCLV